MVYSRAKVLEQYAMEDHMVGASLYPHTLQQHYVVVGWHASCQKHAHTHTLRHLDLYR